MVATHRSSNPGEQNFQRRDPNPPGQRGELQEGVATARRELRLLVLRLMECQQQLDAIRGGLSLPDGEALDRIYEELSAGEESHPAAEMAGALECLAAELREVTRGLGRMANYEETKHGR